LRGDAILLEQTGKPESYASQKGKTDAPAKRTGAKFLNCPKRRSGGQSEQRGQRGGTEQHNLKQMRQQESRRGVSYLEGKRIRLKTLTTPGGRGNRWTSQGICSRGREEACAMVFCRPRRHGRLFGEVRMYRGARKMSWNFLGGRARKAPNGLSAASNTCFVK